MVLGCVKADRKQLGDHWQTPAGCDGGLDFDSDRVRTARSEFLMHSLLGGKFDNPD